MEPKNDLHELRIALGVTQAALARHMGVSKRAYEELESGRTKLRTVHMNAARYAAILIRGDPAVQQRTLPREIVADINNAGYR